MKARGSYSIGADAAATVMPMHLVVGRDGKITGAGPLIRRLLGNARYIQDAFTVDLSQLRWGPDKDILTEFRSGRRILVSVRGNEQLVLRGHGVALADDATLLNFGFGLALPHAIKKFSLTQADFSPSDNVIELLFMYEANQAIIGEMLRANAALESERREAEHMSVTDTLTGLLNRRGFYIECGKLAAAGGVQELAMAALDLDLFKGVNDRFGHAGGDEVLVSVAEAIRSGVRRGDIVARVGGDEFLILIQSFHSRRALIGILKRIVERIEIPVPLEGGDARLSASVGVATFSMSPGCDLGDIIRRADAALYKAKSMGGGAVVPWKGD